MIKEVTREEAIKLLSQGKSVYIFDSQDCTITDISDILGERLIADVEEIEPKKEIEHKKPENPEKSAGGGKVKSVDWGKVVACRKAGWSCPKIADEVGVSDQTIRNYFKKYGDPAKDGEESNG